MWVNVPNIYTAVIKIKLYWKVTLTLWGETAKRFDGSNQPVIAVKATRVRSFVLLLLDLGGNFFFGTGQYL